MHTDPSAAPSRVILVRHGRSTFNDQGRYQGSSDTASLTPKGIETGQQVGAYLRPTAIDVVYTSPLLRTQQTTSEILKVMADGRPQTINISRHLREIDLSVWEGLTYDHVRQHHGAAYECWQQRPNEFKLSTSATTHYFPVRDLYKRAQGFWHHTLPHHGGKTVLIVSHGGTNHALISTALGLSPHHHHSLQQSNCGISVLEFLGSGVQLQQLNQTTPIRETLPKLKAGKKGLRLLLLAEDSLTRAVCDQVARRLAAVKLDFCLSLHAAQPWLPVLMHHHPSTIQFETEQTDFLQNWERELTRSFHPTDGLMTGLAIAPSTSIQALLLQTLGGHLRRGAQLPLKPGCLSIIHYPKNHRPVVQAINT